jgi:hypothetical protein
MSSSDHDLPFSSSITGAVRNLGGGGEIYGDTRNWYKTAENFIERGHFRYLQEDNLKTFL